MAQHTNHQDPAIPTHHKAAVYDSPGQISTALTTVPTPTPGPGEVLVKMTHSGVCYSDYTIMTNGFPAAAMGCPPTAPGQIGGHEGVGTIVSFGPADTAPHPPAGLKLGDRVGIKYIANICGSCFACVAGKDPQCPEAKNSGMTGGAPGTFQEYVVAQAGYVTRIPDGAGSEVAAPMLCAGVTVYAALRKVQGLGFAPGEAVVISGAGGGLGHLGVQIASRCMGYRVIGIDSSDKEPFVRSQGAESFFAVDNYAQDQEGGMKLAQDIKKVTPHGLGAVAVIVCAGSNAAYAQSLSFLRFGGAVICVGAPDGDPVPIASAAPLLLCGREYNIMGSVVGNRKDAAEVLELVARGLVKPQIVVEPMSKLREVFEKLGKGEVQGRVVIDIRSE